MASIKWAGTLDSRLAELDVAMRQAALEVGDAVVFHARRIVKTDTGQLEQSIGVMGVRSVQGQTEVDVGSSLKRSLYLEQGTGIFGPLRKRIDYGKVISFQWPKAKAEVRERFTSVSGRGRPGTFPWVFFRSVAGIQAQPFMVPALEEVVKGYPVAGEARRIVKRWIWSWKAGATSRQRGGGVP